MKIVARSTSKDLPMKDTLYFDGQCSLCRHEIRLLSSARRDTLELQDLNQLTGDYDGPEWNTLMKSLHLRCADGNWLTGVDASVRAWSHTRLGFLWAPLRWPLIAPLADRVYNFWAQRRYARRIHCDQCRIGQ
jgi:predicted DCC family thiol-disulfide oxidoreductase YuxK